MIAALLLASAPVATALDAEAAFARDAKRIGQWSAFRKWADRDAVMFTPQAVWARTFLKPLKNPPRSISWRATDGYVSCDGRTAVNTGRWFTQDGRLAGYFTTVWQRTKSGWRWVYDGGIPAPAKHHKLTATPQVHLATCNGHAKGMPIAAPPALTGEQSQTTPLDNGRGESADKTLGWDWKVAASGARTLRVFQWSKSHYAEVIHAVDPAQKAR
jgi:hypothetical protein